MAQFINIQHNLRDLNWRLWEFQGKQGWACSPGAHKLVGRNYKQDSLKEVKKLWCWLEVIILSAAASGCYCVITSA